MEKDKNKSIEINSDQYAMILTTNNVKLTKQP